MSDYVLLPIKKICLFASGVGYFQHEGEISGSPKLNFSFPMEAINDILKSLVIDDPGTTSPLVSYSAEESLDRTLSGLSVNLSGNPDIAGILNSLRGAEISVQTTKPITGRIIGAHVRTIKPEGRRAANYNREAPDSETYLSLFVDNQIQMIALGEIVSYGFTDEKISGDFHRALDLIFGSHNDLSKNITVSLPGQDKRTVRLGYVMDSPVWKASYRLDLQDSAATKPFLQGWAIVDNVSDTDWQDVELSLVASRPVSFRQNLYPPFHLERPLLPLAIAGYAEAKTYESSGDSEDSCFSAEPVGGARAREKRPTSQLLSPMSYAAINESSYQMTEAKTAGDQFVFTVKAPVTLDRRQSAMIPLTQCTFEGTKMSIFSGDNIDYNPTNPMLGAELVNNTGMKLPAGPISVFDGGTYAGDALLKFFPAKEKQLISYGEDLSVTGIADISEDYFFESVKINQGVLHVTQKGVYEKIYSFRNSSAQDKTVLLEHSFPYNGNAKWELTEPATYKEKIGKLYRFSIPLPAGEEVKFTVRGSYPVTESHEIFDFDLDYLSAYAVEDYIPKPMQKAFEKAAALYRHIEAAKTVLSDTETQREGAIKEQVRIRENINAAGTNSTQGKEYLNKLSALDKQIETGSQEAQARQESVRQAEKAYRDYVSELSF